MLSCHGRTKEETRNYLIAEAAATGKTVMRYYFADGDPNSNTAKVCPVCDGAGLLRGVPCGGCKARGIY
jgi:DnaJ-class molecular chaperone